MKKKKHTYLYKLAASIMLILFMPVTVFFSFYWKRSFDEIEHNQNAYYEKLLDSFSESFHANMMGLKEHAVSVVAYSKDPKSAFYRGSESFKENDYWYYEAARELDEEHFLSEVESFGVYYYEIDCIVTRNSTLTPRSLISSRLEIEDTNLPIWEFFREENYKAGEMLFATSNVSTPYGERMLVGYCTTMGKCQDQVMFFYLIRPGNYAQSMSTVYGNPGIHFYVLDQEQEQVYLALGDAAGEQLEITEADSYRKVGGKEQRILYHKASDSLPLHYSMYITEDSLQNEFLDFYGDMKVVLWVTITILLAICCGVLYVAYKPVYKLTADMDYQEGDEFEAIRNTLNDHNTRLQEQEMLIMDLLLRHLVYGVPIQEKRVKRLGISPDIRHYCVFVLEGHMLRTAEVDKITDKVEQKFAARLFVTDWQGENRNILIAFLSKPDVTEMEQYLTGWLEDHLMDEYRFYSGKVVDKLDAVRISLLSCLEKKKEREADQAVVDKQAIKDEVKTLNPKEEQQKKLKKEILAYLEGHYRDEDLSQTSVADAFQITNYTLSRMFKNQVGVGFTEYVNSKRLEYAKELLLTTNYSVREISVMVGFANDNYFSRIFKATVGMSPTAFREQ